MKRSEMINEIIHILDMKAEELAYPILAELILTTLENEGMLPPKLPTGYNKRTYLDDLMKNEWEVE